ncbi:hypothetical protein GWK47_016843 [Chionoecetes opilio]|uniref:Uncharacterized protein n=1 Tax=Chionoecetes opilio TaxID=41210 RepID=A0A8J4XWF3_CHIOP|nr:hypothetical protein GWK47_016843 [Chionoecetes opilio]
MWASPTATQWTVWRRQPVVCRPTVTGRHPLCSVIGQGSARTLCSPQPVLGTPREAIVSRSNTMTFIRAHRYKYRRRGLMVRRHNVVSARLRLGYRPVWQVAGMAEEPHFTSCQPCDAPSSNTLAHYCLHFHVVRNMLPRGLPLTEICRFLLVHDKLWPPTIPFGVAAGHDSFGRCEERSWMSSTVGQSCCQRQCDVSVLSLDCCQSRCYPEKLRLG